MLSLLLLNPLTLPITIGILLAKAKANGLTATEIADSLGIKPYILTNWKTGRSKPSLEQINKLQEWASEKGFDQQIEKLTEQDVLPNPKEYTTNQNVSSVQNLPSSNSKTEETSDEQLNIMISLFKGLHNPKNKEEAINKVFELRRKESLENE